MGSSCAPTMLAISAPTEMRMSPVSVTSAWQPGSTRMVLGAREQRGWRSQARPPPQPGTPHAQAKEHPNREGTPESSRLPQLGPENHPPTTTARAPQFTMGLTPHTPTLARPQPTCCCQ